MSPLALPLAAVVAKSPGASQDMTIFTGPGSATQNNHMQHCHCLFTVLDYKSVFFTVIVEHVYSSSNFESIVHETDWRRNERA